MLHAPAPFWDQPIEATVEVASIDLCAHPQALFEQLAKQDDPAMLESSALHNEFGRYTVMACHPLDVLTLQDGVLSCCNGDKELVSGSDDALWAAMSSALSAIRLTNTTGQCGYLPGWIGYVGYEVGRHIEKLPATTVRDTALPDLRLAFYDALLIYDGVNHTWQIAELKFSRPVAGAGRGGQALRQIVAQAASDFACNDAPPVTVEQADTPAECAPCDATPNFTPDNYRRAVAKCVDYISAGDIFQVNLSQRFTLHDGPDPLSIYRSLRRRNPSWYAAFLAFKSAGRNCAVASSSPELFLRVRGNKITTRPIKGTRRRCGNAQVDSTAARELLASAKDNAELAMIIDLLRNDLGRVCKFGSVKVTDPCHLETHPTVFHLVGTVEGILRDGMDHAQLLRATFPGGSITGAPKIRAMEIIDELETPARGVYTGCIGHVGVDGSAEWNIAIRTIVCDEDTMHVQAGGGIVADSSPDGEYQETLDKARALLEAIGRAQQTHLAAPAEKRT